jgi:hydroxypyruvate isomerase
VSRWPFESIPLPQFCRAAREIGLVAIDLLNPPEWDVVHDHGLVCSMGYPTQRDNFLTWGFNRVEHHATLLNELERSIPLARQKGVPNVIAMFGNRAGLDDGQGAENCVAGLSTI